MPPPGAMLPGAVMVVPPSHKAKELGKQSDEEEQEHEAENPSKEAKSAVMPSVSCVMSKIGSQRSAVRIPHQQAHYKAL